MKVEDGHRRQDVRIDAARGRLIMFGIRQGSAAEWITLRWERFRRETKREGGEKKEMIYRERVFTEREVSKKGRAGQGRARWMVEEQDRA